MDEQEIKEISQMLEAKQLQADSEKLRNVQQEVMLKAQESSMVREQLDLEEEFQKIDYLLRGYTKEFDEQTGEVKWVAPTDNEMVILSDYGVHLFKNTLAWYLNKNTLLSNYDDETIKQKMEDFATSITDDVFMEYEKIFKYPSFEDCKAILNKRVEDKTKLRVYAIELMGKKADEKAITDAILKDLEPIIERELEKIKQQIMKNKLKRFELLIRKMQDIVHSAYNRAFGGQERKTLREHIHISENKGLQPIQQQKPGGWLNYLRGRS